MRGYLAHRGYEVRTAGGWSCDGEDAPIVATDGDETVLVAVISAYREGAPLGVTDLSRDAMPRRLNVRISDCELGALDRASAGMGCSRSQVVRLLIHCLADGGTRMGAGTVAFDCETSHGIVRNLRSIGTLYDQSVAALDTIAKVARESPDEVAAEDALEKLEQGDQRREAWSIP